MTFSADARTNSWLGSIAPSDGTSVGMRGNSRAVKELLALNPPTDTLVDMLVGAMRDEGRDDVIAAVIAHIRQRGLERFAIDTLIIRDKDSALDVLLRATSVDLSGSYGTALRNGAFRCAQLLQGTTNASDVAPVLWLGYLCTGIAKVGDVQLLVSRTQAAIQAATKFILSCDLPSSPEATLALEEVVVASLKHRAEFLLETIRKRGHTLDPHLLWRIIVSQRVSPALAMPLARHFRMAGTVQIAILGNLPYQAIEELVQMDYDVSEVYQGLDALWSLKPGDVFTLRVLLQAGADPMQRPGDRPSFTQRIAQLHADWIGGSDHTSWPEIAGAVRTLVELGFPYYEDLSAALGREVQAEERYMVDNPAYSWLEVHGTLETIRNLDGPASETLIGAAQALVAHFKRLGDHSDHAASICADLEAFLRAQHHSDDLPDSRVRRRL